ncbi:MAG: hypothetical protein LM582_05045 [Desulfurococcaceae archaeon]|nr:hypothetical protein [Desulfurococcaceae archaeon]
MFSTIVVRYTLARIELKVSEMFIDFINSSLFYIVVLITIFDAMYNEKIDVDIIVMSIALFTSLSVLLALVFGMTYMFS